MKMPTNEERHDVAARLRVLASHVPADAELVLDALDLYEGECIDGFEPRCVDRLADLIEPEPERTCHMTKYGPEYVLSGWWACSECGVVYPPCNDDISAWALQYCPRCGANVVSDAR